MAAPSAPAPSPAAPRRRHWRRGGLVLLSAALVLWLAGRGLGLTGSGLPQADAVPAGVPSAASAGEVEAAVEPTRSGDDGRDSVGVGGGGRAVTPSAPAGESQQAGADAPVAGSAVGSSPGAAPAAGSSPGREGSRAGGAALLMDVATPAAGSVAEPAPQSQPMLDADRFHSLCSIVGLRLTQGELGDAAAALASLRALPLGAGQRAAAEALQERLATAMRDLGAALHASLRRGEVLAARPLADRWFAVKGGAAELPQPLGTLFAGDFDWRKPLATSEVAPPQPTPLDRRRRVRLDWRGELVVGSVAQARADQVTVRVETARGQSYPTLPAVACEPVDAGAEEAIEMALVAVVAREPLLARLWWARAAVLGVDASAPRPARLHDLLR